jgi:sirohydrochlorin ferrochelatase
MEIAEPSIATAYARCVQRGAKHIVVAPFFLGPGSTGLKTFRTWPRKLLRSIPVLAFHVTQTLGIDELILDLLEKRIDFCVNNSYRCEVCQNRVTPLSA